MKKLKIVLFNPKLIGLYVVEKMSKLIFFMILTIILVCTPLVIKQSFKTDISEGFKQELINQLNSVDFKNTSIVNNELIYEENYLLQTSYFNVVIGEEVSSYEYSTLIFTNDKIIFKLFTTSIYSVTYEELNINDIQFNTLRYDVISRESFFDIFNDLYSINKPKLMILFASYVYIEGIIFIFLSALLMAFITHIFNRNKQNVMPFKLKFKTCLNCQYVYLVAYLFAILYGNIYIQFIGQILMMYYVIASNSTIIMIKEEK